jgi:hypothetical protein
VSWDLRLGSASQRGRRPNVQFACVECSVRVEKYVRPGRPPHRFCSKKCATTHAMRSPDRREIARAANTGPNHYGWQGDAVSPEAGRHRARRMYAAVSCSKCGASPAERHHIDENTANNEPSNIAIVCRRCHMEADGRLAAAPALARKIQPLGVKARWSR